MSPKKKCQKKLNRTISGQSLHETLSGISPLKRGQSLRKCLSGLSPLRHLMEDDDEDDSTPIALTSRDYIARKLEDDYSTGECEYSNNSCSYFL